MDVGDLPTEILVEIFSYCTVKDLYYNIRNVSERFASVSYVPSLWRKLDIGEELPLADAILMVSSSSPFSKEIRVENRQDAHKILEEVLASCTHLQSMQIYSTVDQEEKVTIIHRSMLKKLKKRVKTMNRQSNNASITDENHFNRFIYARNSFDLRLRDICRLHPK